MGVKQNASCGFQTRHGLFEHKLVLIQIWHLLKKEDTHGDSFTLILNMLEQTQLRFHSLDTNKPSWKTSSQHQHICCGPTADDLLQTASAAPGDGLSCLQSRRNCAEHELAGKIQRKNLPQVFQLLEHPESSCLTCIFCAGSTEDASAQAFIHSWQQ